MTTDQDTIARREAEAAFEVWRRFPLSVIQDSYERRAFIAGYLSRHQSDRERVLEAARVYAATKPTDPARLLRDRERSLLTRASALAAETQEQA